MAALFEKMAGNVRGVVSSAQSKTAEEKQMIADLQAKLDTQAAGLAALKVDKDQYELQKAQVQKLYTEAKSQAESAETRAFVSELVGGIFSAVGQGLAGNAAAKTPSIKIGSVFGCDGPNGRWREGGPEARRYTGRRARRRAAGSWNCIEGCHDCRGASSRHGRGTGGRRCRWGGARCEKP